MPEGDERDTNQDSVGYSYETKVSLNTGALFGTNAGGPGAYAILALVLGIGSVVMTCLAGIPAIILGHMALGQITRGEASESGRKIAIAGLVIAYITTLVYGGLIFVVFALPFLVALVGVFA